MGNPEISVVMGVYNGAGQLSETIQSVLAQTFEDFEFIILNDGSTDAAVAQILNDYARRDARIRVITKANEGLTKALIAGCTTARGKYIARIDVCDEMLPERLAKQCAVLDEHSSVSFVSCWTEYCGPEWETLFLKREQTPKAGKDILPTAANRYPSCGPTHHGSVMFRHNVYRSSGGYRSEFYYGQDWDLWYRLAEIGMFAAVPEVLYRCRIFPDGISMGNAKRQEQIGRCSLAAYWCRRRGDSEDDVLKQAAAIRPDMVEQGGGIGLRKGYGAHFVGELLRKKKDYRCLKYFRLALAENPFRLNTLFRFTQAVLGRY